MAKLIMSDGEVKTVTYDKAARVYQILTGNKEPKDEAQADFVATVERVDFDRLSKISPSRSDAKIEHDLEMDKILADKTLMGLDKARAVADRIKQRVV